MMRPSTAFAASTVVGGAAGGLAARLIRPNVLEFELEPSERTHLITATV